MDRTPIEVSYKHKLVQAEMIISAIEMALDGELPTDFELSFSIIRKAWDTWNIANKRVERTRKTCAAHPQRYSFNGGIA